MMLDDASHCDRSVFERQLLSLVFVINACVSFPSSFCFSDPNKHQIAEVALSIIFILETSTREQLSASSSPFTMADALATLQQHGSLSLYLQHFEASSLSS
jgi:hypothetical protein